MYDRPNLSSVSRHTHRQVAHVLSPAAVAPLTGGPAVETASRDTPPLGTNSPEMSPSPTGAPANAPSAPPIASQEVCTPFIVSTTVHSVAPPFHCPRGSLVATITDLTGAEKQCRLRPQTYAPLSAAPFQIPELAGTTASKTVSVITAGSVAVVSTTSTLSGSGTGILSAVFGESSSGSTVRFEELLLWA